MEIIIRPRDGENVDGYYMDKLYDTIELVVDEIEKKMPKFLPVEVVFGDEICSHNFEVIEHDEISNTVTFQCTRCEILYNARININYHGRKARLE